MVKLCYFDEMVFEMLLLVLVDVVCEMLWMGDFVEVMLCKVMVVMMIGDCVLVD